MVGRIGSSSAAVLAGLLSAALMLGDAPSALAHPGGLAADGCHKDRRNGGRHCHGGGSTVTLATPGKAKGKRKAKRKARPKAVRPARLLGGGVQMLADNPSVPDAVAYDGELHILGRVVAIVRKT